MSVKPSDVGNLDDFAESDEDEANGPGAPEVRARGPQSGGLTVIYGWRLLRPKMDHMLGVLGQARLVLTQREVLITAPPTCPAALIFQA